MRFYNTKDTAKQQAEQFGPQWKAQVTNADTNSWKPLDEWQEVYEPPQPPQQQSAAASYMAGKAKQVLVNNIQSRVSDKLMTVAQETTSKLLTRAEQEATAAATNDNDTTQTLAWTTLSQLLNNFNAIVLTFRFEKDNSQQCLYLRRVATDNVAKILYEIFQTTKQAGQHLKDLRKQVTRAIESQKFQVKEFVTTSLDQALQEAVAQANASVENKLTQAQLQFKKATTNTALENVISPTTELDEDRQQEIATYQDKIQQEHVDIQDESVKMLSDCIKLLVIKKMDTLVILLVYVVDCLFDSVEGLYKTVEESQLSQQQLSQNVYNVIEGAHEDYQQKLQLEVKRGVTVLQAIMQDDGGDDGNVATRTS